MYLTVSNYNILSYLCFSFLGFLLCISFISQLVNYIPLHMKKIIKNIEIKSFLSYQFLLRSKHIKRKTPLRKKRTKTQVFYSKRKNI